MRLWCRREPPQSGALPMLATDPAAWTCSTVQSQSNSLPLFFYLLPQGATTERSDYPPIKSWQFAAINRDCDSQSAWQFLRTGLQRLICSKSSKMHPGRPTWPDRCTILGNSNGLSTLATEAGRECPDPHEGPADLTLTLHIIELFIYLKDSRWLTVKEMEQPWLKKKVNRYKGVPPKSKGNRWHDSESVRPGEIGRGQKLSVWVRNLILRELT